MTEHDLDKLLGGFAADTLTPEERRKLYQAAIEDQEVVHQPADERSLKDLLSDPTVRRRLSEAVGPDDPQRSGPSWLAWFRKPAGVAFAGGLALALLALFFGIRTYDERAIEPVDRRPNENVAAPGTGLPSEAPQAQPSPSPLLPPRIDGPAATIGDGQNHMGTMAPDQDPSQVGARDLFYRALSGPAGKATQAARGRRSLAEPAETQRAESKAERFVNPRKSAGFSTEQAPLGFRYGFITVGATGREEEISEAAVRIGSGSTKLTVEANQASYLQVWRTAVDRSAQLLLPDKETGKISLKIAAGQREQISLPPETEPMTLTIRLSRMPFGPIARQEAVLLGRLSSRQLTQTIAPGEPSGLPEHATYVVRQDSSPDAQVVATIRLGR
jgi:hypothetical protein